MSILLYRTHRKRTSVSKPGMYFCGYQNRGKPRKPVSGIEVVTSVDIYSSLQRQRVNFWTQESETSRGAINSLAFCQSTWSLRTLDPSCRATKASSNSSISGYS
jgi:hypothetical protein